MTDGIYSIIEKLTNIYDQKNYEQLPAVITALKQYFFEHRDISGGINKADLLYQYTNEALVVLEDRIIRDCTPVLAKITGFSCTELVNMDFLETVHADDKMRITDVLKSARENSITFTGLHQSGGIYYAEMMLFHAGFGQSMKIGLIRDVSEQKALETRLRESETKFRNLANSASVAIMLYQGNHWVYANPAAERISGYSLEELVQLEFWSFVAPEYREMIKKRGKQRQKGDDVPTGYEFKIIHKSGEERWVHLDGKLTIFEGKPAGLISIIDITHIKNVELTLKEKNSMLKKTETQLQETNKKLNELNEKLQKQNVIMKQAKDKAEESDRLKSAFLANMSHEIRTPMNAIMGFAEILAGGEVSPELQQEYGDTIYSRSKYLLQIINDIVDISKIEADLLTIYKTSFKLDDLLADLKRTYTRVLDQQQKSHIRLEIDKPAEVESVTVYSDKNRLEQILTNLIGNAIKFTDKGSITIGYRHPGSDLLEVFVRDTGTGINPHEADAIFDRFVMATNAVNEKHQGTGLGLAISKSLAELLGGNIWVEQTTNKGTDIHFNFLYKNQTRSKNSVAVEVQSDFELLNDITVMIIEDDRWSTVFLQTLLEGRCAGIIICKNAEEALKQIAQNIKVDLVLLDLKLPGMSGFEAVKTIKKRRPRLPVIAETAYALNKDRDRAIEAGCDAYIAKPIDAQKLINTMYKTLKKFY